jgi:hypothetical protein
MYSKESFDWAAGVMAGSKIRSNLNLPDHQEEKEVTDILINMTACYPGDGSTIARKVLQTNWGGSCRGPTQSKDRSSCGILDGDASICFMDQQCHCTMDPTKFSYGDYITRIATLKQEKLKGNDAAFFACWYDAVPEMELLLEASNSLWLSRKDWGNQPDSTYNGWAECPVTANMNDPRSLDAIVIQTSIVQHQNQSNLCHLLSPSSRRRGFSSMYGIPKSLRALHRKYGQLPVLFLSQVQGMSEDLCEEYWKGVDCQDGIHKSFFAQTYNFPDGSCLAEVPDEECEGDVFFYPDCSNRTTTAPSICQTRRDAKIVLLPAQEPIISQDPIVVPIEQTTMYLLTSAACLFFWRRLWR